MLCVDFPCEDSSSRRAVYMKGGQRDWNWTQIEEGRVAEEK